MKKNPFENIENLWVLMTPIRSNPPIPYMGPDGRAELFTEQKLAEAGANTLFERLQVKTEVKKIEGKEVVYDFLRTCMKRRMMHFRLNNGDKDMQDLKFEDFLDYRESNLVDEKNRYVQFLLMRSQIYRYYMITLYKGKPSGKYGLSLAETEMTMRFNAYRETYRGILYALTGKFEGDEYFDFYSVAALDRAKEWLKDPEVVKYGYKAAGLLHPGHKGGVVKAEREGLFYVNNAGQDRSMANGMICAFTSYENALRGREVFESSGTQCSVIALTAQEIQAESMQCAGILVDWPVLNYEITKAEYGKWKTYGEMNAPIIVNLTGEKSEK